VARYSSTRVQRGRKNTAYKLFVILLSSLFAPFIFLFIENFNNMQIIKYDLLDGPITNPLMGWAPWGTIIKSEQPHSLVYADLTWRELEPQEGVYDFAYFEGKQQLTRWRNKGMRVVFRFVIDKPGSENHLDIPDWLFNKIEGDGDYYDNSYGKGFSPNYSNPTFIEYHAKAIENLGSRYSQDGFFAYIELGSLGHWGEWHVNRNSAIRPLPIAKIREKYVHPYIEFFPKTHLLMRRPFSAADQHNLGLYNDMTTDLKATSTWLNWIKNGGNYNQTNELNGLVPMENAWQLAPIGGEQAPSVSNAEAYNDNLVQTINLLRNSHTTFIGPGGPYDLERKGVLQIGIDQVLENIGYRIVIEQTQMPKRIRFGNHAQVTMTFSNQGIAPFYYNWPIKMYLFDESKTFVYDYPLEMDLQLVLPGTRYDITVNFPLNRLVNGLYTIGFAIIDPISNQPAVKLAIENSREDLIYELGSFKLTGLQFLRDYKFDDNK
jgi:hypothetical protein